MPSEEMDVLADTASRPETDTEIASQAETDVKTISRAEIEEEIVTDVETASRAETDVQVVSKATLLSSESQVPMCNHLSLSFSFLLSLPLFPMHLIFPLSFPSPIIKCSTQYHNFLFTLTSLNTLGVHDGDVQR